MTCAICSEKVYDIGLAPLRPDENRVCLDCLEEHGLEGVREILQKRFAKGRLSKADAVGPEIVPQYPGEYRPPKR